MNNPGPPGGPVFSRFTLTQSVNVRVIIDRKIHYMQRIVSIFGPEALGRVMNATHPIVVPFILYEHGFDVFIYILI